MTAPSFMLPSSIPDGIPVCRLQMESADICVAEMSGRVVGSVLP
jgi:hypothetical protein